MEKEKTLKNLFQNHKGKLSDKWSLYLDEWDRLFGPYRNYPVHLLEIGVQNGGSLEVWGKFFKKATHIVGVDIDQKCALLKYKNPRISVIVGDANSDECESKILQQVPEINIIIDDGSHMSSDIIRSFARYFPYLQDGGIYVVEDLHSSYWYDFEGGLNNPLSSMSFFKRLTDILNNEHWRNKLSRRDILGRFESEFGIVFDEDNLARIHSLELINSLCVIRKSALEKNALGKRMVVGASGGIEAELENYKGMDIRDLDARITDDTGLDVFKLMDTANLLSKNIDDREQVIQSITLHNAELMRSIESLDKQANARELVIQDLGNQMAERNQTILSLSNQVAERDLKIKTLDDHLVEQEESAQALTAHLIEKVTLVNKLGLDIDTILSSTSWKISWPVRAVKSLLIVVLHGTRKLVSKIGSIVIVKKSPDKDHKIDIEKHPSYSHNQIAGGQKISVVVTSYNHDRYIRQCCDSILSQRGDYNLEVILGDDSSTDSTRDILQQYSQSYLGLFRLLPAQENMGVTRNLKRCLDACTGDFIAICEGDDYWTDDHKLEKQMLFLDEHKDYSMCFSELMLYFESENRFSLHPGQQGLKKIAITTADLVETNYIGNFSCCMYRADTIKKLPAGLFDMYTVDWMFNMACGEIGNIGFIKEPMSVYRLHSHGAWSGKMPKEQLDAVIQSIEVYDSFLKNKYQEQFLRLKSQLMERKE